MWGPLLHDRHVCATRTYTPGAQKHTICGAILPLYCTMSHSCDCIQPAHRRLECRDGHEHECDYGEFRLPRVVHHRRWPSRSARMRMAAASGSSFTRRTMTRRTQGCSASIRRPSCSADQSSLDTLATHPGATFHTEHARTRTHALTHAITHAITHARTCTPTHTHSRTQANGRTHTCTLARTHARARTHLHTYTYTQAHAHTRTHTRARMVGSCRLDGYSEEVNHNSAFYAPSFVVSPKMRADDGYRY